MTNKDKIKEEIERRIVKAEEFAERAEGANDDSSKLSWDFVATQNKSLIQFIDSLQEEPASKDLDEYYTREFLPKEWFAKPGQRTISQFNFFTAHHFAEWQKEKDKQLVGATQKISHQHGYDEGRLAMKEEMMKTLIEGEIVKDMHNQLKVTSEPLNDTFGKFGDRVKIIIVKED